MDAYAIKDGEWEDITEDFLSSTKQLNLGELLKSDYFTLWDAMSAMELMDPKIDSGMMIRNYKNKILNLEQSIKRGLVKINNLRADELIGIMDETFACMATWLDGNFLSQTVMINLYLHEPERIEDRCLRIYSQCILKLVEFFDKLVQMSNCIEEEDFQLNMGRFNLACHMGDQKVLNSLGELCQHYERILNPDKQGTSNQASLVKRQQQHQEIDQNELINNNEPQYDKQSTIAIVDRLRFTYHLYACLYIISKNLLKVHWDLNSVTDGQLPKTIKLVQQYVQDCDQHLEKCYNYLNALKSTLDIGIKPEQVDGTHDNGCKNLMGFEPLVNYRILPVAFARHLTIKSRPDAIDFLMNLVEKLRTCISLSSAFNQKSFDKSLDSIEGCKYLKPCSCVISRSFLQLLYLPNRSSKLMKEELLQSMNEYCEPLVQHMRKEESSSNVLDIFMKDCSKTFLQVINLYGHNAARQHEKYPVIIEAFKNLQYTAFVFNSVFNDKIVYSWITCYLARLCIKYVHASLELDLFSPHEYPYVFWYLQDILYWNEREQLDLAKQYIFESQLSLDEAQKKAKIKKQRKKGQHSTMYHDKCLLRNEAHRYLSGGLFLLTYGLRLQGKIKSPVMDFTSEKTSFDRRFGSITSSSVFNSYTNTLKRFEKLDTIYSEAFRRFTEAKNIFELMGGHESCLKVCKTNLVVARILSTNPDLFPCRKAEFCFDIHPSLPTVKF